MTKLSATLLFSLLLFCGLGYAADHPAGAVPDTAGMNAASNHKVIVYYLYFTPRCETCLNMEAYAKEAVEKGFPEELKQGRVEWHAYDTDKEQYKHFWTDFKLDTKSLVMVDIVDGKTVRWKNCEQTWDLVNVKPTYLKYVQDELRAYLRGDPDVSDSTSAKH